jgi:hypothetical protein
VFEPALLQLPPFAPAQKKRRNQKNRKQNTERIEKKNRKKTITTNPTILKEITNKK